MSLIAGTYDSFFQEHDIDWLAKKDYFVDKKCCAALLMDDKKLRELLFEREQIEYELYVIEQYGHKDIYTKTGNVFVAVPKENAIEELKNRKRAVNKKINSSGKMRV